MEKEKKLKEKDLIIKELQEKINRLELENIRTKEKLNKLHSRTIRRSSDNTNKLKTEDEELAFALEKINEMERSNNRTNSSNIINNYHLDRNDRDPFGLIIDPSDVININSISDHPCMNILI